MIFTVENVCFMSMDVRADVALIYVLLLQGFRILPCQTTFFLKWVLIVTSGKHCNLALSENA